MPRSKKPGLRPKVIECEACGELVTVGKSGLVPKFCAKHRKNGARLLARKSKTPSSSGSSSSPASSSAAGVMPAAAFKLRGMGRLPKGVRPKEIACEVCGETVPVAAKSVVPRFCKKHRVMNALRRPPSRPPTGPDGAPVNVGKRRGKGSTLELARSALRFAGLHVARALDSSEGVMILVRRNGAV